MDIFGKEKIASMQLEIETLTSQCEILREGNARLRGELKLSRECEFYSSQNISSIRSVNGAFK